MKKILYVEDNEMNRDMLGRRLSRRDFEVIFAFDGQEGLDKMKSENSEDEDKKTIPPIKSVIDVKMMKA